MSSFLARALCGQLRRSKCANYRGFSSKLQVSDSGRGAGAISGVGVSRDGRHVEVTWSEPECPAVSRFPNVYLRDNCPQNFCPHSYQRLTYLKDLDLGVRATDARVSPADGVTVTWSDGRTSHYTAHWLRLHSLDTRSRDDRRHNLYRTKPLLWDTNYISQNVKKFRFTDVLSNDTCLHDWLYEVESLGIAFLYDAPLEGGQLHRIARRVAFEKVTHYGDKFEVKNKARPSNVAYTDGFLALHTDLPVLDYNPGIQLLHCIKQSSAGGESLFSDAFQAAELLRQENPEYFRILTTTLVDFDDMGIDYTTFYTCGKHYTIQVDDYGDYERVSFSNASRSTFLDLPAEEVEDFYAALFRYNQLLHSDELLFKQRLEQGDVAVFNNTRVLHGRMPYSSAGCSCGEDGERWLQGMYFDTDHFRSTLRVMRHKLGYYVSKQNISHY